MFDAVPLQAPSGISPYNPLVVALVLVAAGAAVSAVYVFREARGTHEPGDRESFAWLFGLIGGIALLISGEIFWANWAGFPAAQYTELFGVAETLYATVMLAAAFVIYRGLDPKPLAWITSFAGVILLQGAHAILSFELTLQPIVSAGIWIAAGVAGVLLLPAAYVDDDSGARTYLAYGIWVFLVVLAGLTLFMGFEAHFSHIAEVMAQQGGG
ncbi:MAG: DUF981 family protein [Salinigranum sp.]